VTVDVDTKTTKAGFMQWDMTQNHSVENMVCTKFTKVLSILVIPKDVMVAADKNLVAVETPHDTQGLTIDYHIAQVIYFVARAYSVVPTSNHFFVHFLCGVPGPKLGLTVGSHEMTDTIVPKMGITD
jgi:hypothetical protein